MKVIGIGIDVVEVDRIKSSLEEFSERFLSRVFTRLEREYCQKQKMPELHLAARFAAKEAIAKAFGTGIGKEIGWLDMEILRKESGEPEVQLRGDARGYAKQRGVEQIMVSLTHAKQYAAANAVILGA
ncbi:holo-ACP synthase [Akkermansiaceae bacterium]|nr:holo-ACP synthase [Akkermansiaceae bacterium]